MERNELCWCGSGKKYKKCHMQIDDKILLLASEGHIVPDRSMLKTPAQIEEIKKSAALNTAVLDHVAKHIHAGMSTAEIDKLVYDYTTEHGGQAKNIQCVLSTSCSLLHVPYTLKHEHRLSKHYTSYFAFAEEKLDELAQLKELAQCEDYHVASS